MWVFLKRPDQVSLHAIKSSGVSILFWAFNLLMFPILYIAMDFFKDAYAFLGIPSVSAEFWQDWPLWALIIVAVVSRDFVDYWNHRFMHMKWLWPIHAIHHSDTHVNGLTTYRIHFLEAIFMDLCLVLMMSWLGMPSLSVVLARFFIILHNMYVHTNLDIEHGPFKLLLASPRYHRWHHADVPEAYGKNLANIFPIYDYIFGTYYVPGKCMEKMGAKETGVPDLDFVKLVLYPFAEFAKVLGRFVGLVLKDPPAPSCVDENNQQPSQGEQSAKLIK
jgi:sterol desaturase/sphingolipid hydroxylase (fatty acid hydroxylase superfamily)